MSMGYTVDPEKCVFAVYEQYLTTKKATAMVQRFQVGIQLSEQGKMFGFVIPKAPSLFYFMLNDKTGSLLTLYTSVV